MWMTGPYWCQFTIDESRTKVLSVTLEVIRSYPALEHLLGGVWESPTGECFTWAKDELDAFNNAQKWLAAGAPRMSAHEYWFPGLGVVEDGLAAVRNRKGA